MRTTLVVLGVIFLVIGVLLYLVPMQEIAGTTTSGGSESTTSSASVNIPLVWSLAAALIGIVLLVLGLVEFEEEKSSEPRNRSFGNIFGSNDNFRDGDNKIVRQRTETRTARKDDWDLN